MPTYIAFTLGPIVRSLTSARKTRELWAASYTFSWLMKGVATELQQGPGSENRTFVLPFTDRKDSSSPYGSAEARQVELHGAGIFPDRIIFQTTQPDDLAHTRNVLMDQIKHLATDIHDVLDRPNDPVSVEAAKHYLQSYLNAHFLEREIPAAEISPEMDEQARAKALKAANPILVLSPVLDALEQRISFPAVHEPFLARYWKEASLSQRPVSVLATDAFGSYRSLNKKTLEHIAVAEFLTEESPESASLETDDSGNLIAAFQSREDFLPAHKYVAIVQADGDNVGKTIGALSDDQFQPFSHLLKDFSIEAVGRIAEYGGLPVYAGGDDLLFFAPVVNRNASGASQNIFALLKTLDEAFQQKMKESGISYDDSLPLPTLSFGLSISYYKFPLYESLATGQHLLFGVAKDEALNPAKNTIAFEIRKHSGATFGGRLQLGQTRVAKAYGALLQTLFARQNEQLLASVSYKLRREKTLLGLFGKDSDRVAAYLDNSFNEKVHQREPQKSFLLSMKELVPAVYNQFDFQPSEEEQKQEAINDDDPRWPHSQLFGLIRSLQFLIDESND